MESSGPEIEPMSPALAGRFLTSGPSGKPQYSLLKVAYLRSQISLVSKETLVLCIKQKGLPWWLSRESTYNAGDVGSIPGLGRSPGKGNGNPFHYSCLGSPMDRGNWWATVLGISKRVILDLAIKQLQLNKTPNYILYVSSVYDHCYFYPVFNGTD